MGFFIPSLNKAEEFDLAYRHISRETPLSEYLPAKVRDAFGYTTTSSAVDDIIISGRERDAYISEAEEEELTTPTMRHLGIKAPRSLAKMPTLSKAEYEASEFFRPNVKWKEGMTPVRAQYIAEEYDAKEYRRSLIERSPDGFRNILGFGASLMGAIVDPLTFIPLGSGIKAATIGRAALEASLAGAGVGFTMTALTHEHLEEMGEEVSEINYILNTAFGAAAGGIFGAAGKALSKVSQRAIARAEAAEAGRGGAIGVVDDALPVERVTLDDAVPAIAEESDAMLEYMRAVIPMTERQTIMDMAELAVQQQIIANEPVNVSALYRNSGGLSVVRNKMLDKNSDWVRAVAGEEVFLPARDYPTGALRENPALSQLPSFTVATPHGEQPMVKAFRAEAATFADEALTPQQHLSNIAKEAVPEHEVTNLQTALDCIIGAAL